MSRVSGRSALITVVLRSSIVADRNVPCHVLTQMWVLPSLAAMLWMMHLSSGSVQLLTTLVYGLSLFLLFAVSTTFHVLAYCGDRFQ